MTSEVGSTANSYEILAKLAEGGMAEIFLARGASGAGVMRHVVLKRVLREHASNTVFVQMFLEEARLAAQLQHPNIAQVFDVGQLGASYFFTMEYVHGVTVRALLDRAKELGTPVPIASTLAIIVGAAAGLGHAHQRAGMDGKPLGIVHRDVSPANLMVSFEGNVKVVDFGVAKAIGSPETQAGSVKGKISYLSPEQCRGQKLDCRSDLFALGIVMWEMLTGRRPFHGATPFETMAAIATDEVPPPSRYRPEVPRELDALVGKLLAKDLARRHQTAEAVIEDLEALALKTKSSLSSSSLARLLRELFGVRPEPWLSLEREAITVSVTPVPEILAAAALDDPELADLELKLTSQFAMETRRIPSLAEAAAIAAEDDDTEDARSTNVIRTVDPPTTKTLAVPAADRETTLMPLASEPDDHPTLQREGRTRAPSAQPPVRGSIPARAASEAGPPPRASRPVLPPPTRAHTASAPPPLNPSGPPHGPPPPAHHPEARGSAPMTQTLLGSGPPAATTPTLMGSGPQARLGSALPGSGPQVPGSGPQGAQGSGPQVPGSGPRSVVARAAPEPRSSALPFSVRFGRHRGLLWIAGGSLLGVVLTIIVIKSSSEEPQPQLFEPIVAPIDASVAIDAAPPIDAEEIDAPVADETPDAATEPDDLEVLANPPPDDDPVKSPAPPRRRALRTKDDFIRAYHAKRYKDIVTTCGQLGADDERAIVCTLAACRIRDPLAQKWERNIGPGQRDGTIKACQLAGMKIVDVCATDLTACRR